MSTARYVMVIDQRRCIGCHTCAIACKSENNMPNGAAESLNTVITENSSLIDVPSGNQLGETCTMDTYMRRDTNTLKLNFLTRSCQHCVDAPCVKACPVNATFQHENGIVDQDTNKCIGCMECMKACPFPMGTMRVPMGFKPEFPVDFTSGSQDIYPTRPQTVKKCTFCNHRLTNENLEERYRKPFCVDHCPGRARFFGNINDTESEVYKLLHSGRKIKQHAFATRDGSTPNESSVYFLEHDLP